MPSSLPAGAGPALLGQARPLPLRAGTRGSILALIQTRLFLAALAQARPSLQGEGVLQEHVITTTGDAVQDRALAEIGGKGLFAREIHEALADGRIDFAVHSLKDLETELPPGIVLGGFLKADDPRDVLIPNDTLIAAADAGSADPFAILPPNALIGTSSVRRQAQLLHARPDLRMTLLRGNVQTRLRKLQEGACQASLLALAGLRRLGNDIPGAIILDPQVMLPAAAQGVIGITTREADADLRDMLDSVTDPDTQVTASCERAMLAALDGSCRTPIGAYAQLGPDRTLSLTGLIAAPDGSFLLKRSLTATASDALPLGRALGESLRADAPAALFA